MVVITSVYILSNGGLYMAEKMKCITITCRVDEYYLGDWKDGVWEYEESSAWSMLKKNCCPGCGEVGEDL